MLKKETGEKFKEWFVVNAQKPKAAIVLYLVSFFDAFILPLPPDPFQSVLTLINPRRWARYAFFTVIWSVLGGLFGYFLGAVIFNYYGDLLTEVYNLDQRLVEVGNLFEDKAFLTIFIAALTPIPYQIFTVAGGVFSISVFPFIWASILGRSIRFFAVGYIMKIFGEKYGQQVFKYFNYILLAIGILVILKIFFL